tara:strand:- start:256 stop:636 length:381 start_codon:yes stop_codon:yes gene_type:complete
MRNEIIKEYIKINVSGWDDDLKDKFGKSLFKSLAHWNILLLIAENTYFEKDYSFEKLCRLINPSVASRATIQRIITELIDLELIEKQIKATDHRVKYFFLTNNGMNLFSKYVEQEIETYQGIRNIL